MKLVEAMGLVSRPKRLTASKLRSLILREAKLIREEMSDEEAVKAIQKGLDISDGVEATVAFLKSPEGNDPKVRAFLAAGEWDEQPADEKMDVGSANPTLSGLEATQNEVGLPNSIGYPLSVFDSLKAALKPGGDPTGRGKRIIISGDKVIDGHHRWSQKMAIAGPDDTIPAIDISLPGGSAVNQLAAAQVAVIAALNKNDPGATGVPKAKSDKLDNVLGQSSAAIEKKIRGYYESGTNMESGAPLLSDDYMAQVMGDADVKSHFGIEDADDADIARDKIIDVVATNLDSTNLKMADGAPGRDIMPQFTGGDFEHEDKVSVKDVVQMAKAGSVNYQADFKPIEKKTEEAKEEPEKKLTDGRVNSDAQILERWQKLAGMLAG